MALRANEKANAEAARNCCKEMKMRNGGSRTDLMIFEGNNIAIEPITWDFGVGINLITKWYLGCA